MIRVVAGIVPAVSSMFLLLMAILVNSSALFYMSTAMIALIMASRVQAYLSVRGLRFERVATHRATVGQRVDIALTVWSEKRIKRPLIIVQDQLPSKLKIKELSPSLPIAPCFDQPVRATYSFIPMKRGRYSWHRVLVSGTDALGLVSMSRVFETEPMEVTVYPVAIPVDVPIAPSFGWGQGDIEQGVSRGSGIEPRGIRDYASGDPLRFVHWKSVAKGGRLLVKEFESGAPSGACFFLQQTLGSDITPPDYTLKDQAIQGATQGVSTLEAMCGHAKFMAEAMLRLGSIVKFPGLEVGDSPSYQPEERLAQIDEILLNVQADKASRISEDLSSASAKLGSGASIYLFLTIADPSLPAVLRELAYSHKVCLVYDPADYSGQSRDTLNSAASPEYLAHLQAAGAEIRVMPKVEAFL